MTTPLVFLMGPTASGKTALAIELVERMPFEIVSVDSAMVYRSLDIGTGKPTAEELARAPHHLIDVCDPHDAYSAARFRDDAGTVIQKIIDEGRIPLLVGGTGLYFRALKVGLSSLPSANAPLRAALAQRAARHGWPALHAELARVDAMSADRIHPNDPQRIQRALEVYELTGTPMSELHRTPPQRAIPFSVMEVIIEPADREPLHARIAARFHRMLDDGLIEEVVRLKADSRLHRELPSMRAVGYRQVWEHLMGETDRATMTQRAIVATRQLAKRQSTWLRGQVGGTRFDSEAPDRLEQVLQYFSSRERRPG